MPKARKSASHNTVQREKRVLMEQQRPNFRVSVRDYGPIASGEVELRPLTVFAGPSNTGKSWLAILIYALLKSTPVNHLERDFPLAYTRFDQSETAKALKKSGLSSFPAEPAKWLYAMDNESDIILTEKEREAVTIFASQAGLRIEKEMKRCYGIADVQNFIRWNAREKTKIDAYIGNMRYRMKIGGKSNDVTLVAEYDPDVSLNLSEAEILKSMLMYSLNDAANWEGSNTHFEMFKSYGSVHNIVWCLRQIVGQRSIYGAHYLPSDRGGIMHAHAAVVSALLGNAAYTTSRIDPSLPVLSGVLSDFMMRIVEMAEISENENSDKLHLDAGISENILSGRVEVKKMIGGYPRFVYYPNERKESLALVNASSMVSEVGPLALYLRYLVAPGDVLILEEPEAHLHPKLQRQLVAEAIKWTKMGVRTIITTHSEWVINELSNAVSRGNGRDEDEIRQDGSCLTRGDVGVWHFSGKGGNGAESGSHIKEVLWEPDKGGYDTGFFDVLVEQNNEWADSMESYNWEGEEK